MNYYIYLIKNKVNKKIYIGKRKCPPTKNPISDSYMGSGVVLKRAFKKYGKEQFEKQILIENIVDLDLINKLEKEFISKFESTKREKGYNRTLGGDGGHTTRLFTEEELKAYRLKHIGKTFSEESRQKLREKVNIPIVKDNLKKAHIAFKILVDSGWKQSFSKETREKMSAKSKISHNKRVQCVDTGIEYESMGEAANNTNSSLSKISLCCNGKRKKTNNLHWKFI